ncbi:SMI1/KNR4 family protein [Verrucomicrobiales bacterium BCK34]|nr:SMI1/KNR4 family protein [Verrucomicrobiales bacterium BCK34]
MKTGITSGQWTLIACAGIITIVVNVVIIRFGKQDSLNTLKTKLEETAPGFPASTSEDDSEIELLDKAVTEEGFFKGRHFSVSDHSRKALKDWPLEDGSLVPRAPVGASETMIECTEKRIGFPLPDKLKNLYKIRDGGSLPTYWVPAVENPEGKYHDWIDAFSNDYNDLRPLDSLTLLHDGYLEYFDPEYDDPAVKESWFPGSEKLLVLTQRYGIATLLDYRTNETTPGVLLVDLDQDPGQQIRTQFESFEAFFKALREEHDFLSRTTDSELPDRKQLRESGYDPQAPHQFWASSSANASHGVSDENWQNAQSRLKLPLPEPFKPLYEALDGGIVAYPFHPGLGVDEDGEPQSPFSGHLYSVGGLLPLESWITLDEFSSRLDFKGEKPYKEIHSSPERLIVIAASYDTALLLDYRERMNPTVVYHHDLNDPDNGIMLGTTSGFLSSLRRRQSPYYNDPSPMTDVRLSPRVANPDSFWHPNPGTEGASEETLKQANGRIGKAIPDQIAGLLKKQNGGTPVFRFLPPVGERKDPMGKPLADSSQNRWADLFPGGILPVGKWMTFHDFRKVRNIALEQDIRETLMPEMMTEPNVEERLLVIGHRGKQAITLLDLSEGSFSRTPYLSRADYSEENDEYRLTIAPLSTNHYTHGAIQLLRAKIDELE